MRVIICGAGQVGYSIASYLAREENDVTVIDLDRNAIEEVSETLDVNAMVGHASDPEVLAAAGARDADLIVAVTDLDEVNMVACQVAHSLFGVPKKIARIRNKGYLGPEWANLFSRAHMPIDVIISPEREVARSIGQRLRIPGTTSVVPLARGRVYLVGVMCDEACPLLNMQLEQLHGTFPDLCIEIAAILRKGAVFLAGPDDQIQAGDEVFFFSDADHVPRAMAVFGHEEHKARQITIVGGGNVGMNLVRLIREEHKDVRIKLVEVDENRAVEISKAMPDIVVLHGNILNASLMREAGMDHTETLIAVTNDDETNILSSLMAKQHGCQRVIALVNNPSYANMTGPLGIDATVSPRSSTVSTIMQHVRRGRIKALHSLRGGLAEIIEAEVSETIPLANVAVSDLKLPKDVAVAMIMREDRVILPRPDFVIRPGDHVMMLAAREQARKMEQMFSVQVDLF